MQFEREISILFNLADDLLQASRKCTISNYCVVYPDRRRNSTAISEMFIETSELLHSALPGTAIAYIFENHTCLETLIIMSGGNRTQLYSFLRELFGRIEYFPATQKDVNRVISEAKMSKNRSIESRQWDLIAKCHQNPFVSYAELAEYEWLRESRTIFLYGGESGYWSANPLVLDLYGFREALAKLI